MVQAKVSWKQFQGIRRKMGYGSRSGLSGGIVRVKQTVRKTKAGVVVVKEHTRTNALQMSGHDFRSKATAARNRAHLIQSTRKRALAGRY